MPIHEKFNLPYWIREFKLESLADQTRAWAATQTEILDDPQEAAIERDLPTISIDGPKDLAVIEQIRTGFGPGTLGPPTPTDIFTWALGEPANSASTKIGGVPYRPADFPWPARNNKPLSLLAQICFADSHDIAKLPPGLLHKSRPLPGDVLLIFSPGDYLVDWDDDEQDSLYFEWQPLGISNLIDPKSVPPSKLTPAHAHIHRTMDFVNPPQGHSIYNLYSARKIGLLNGTKIGGIPVLDIDDAPRGTHLCTLSSLRPYGEHFPLLNVPTNPKGDNYVDDNLLMMADCGNLYLFIDKNAKIHWAVRGG